jgi:prepilin-type processing-associated H-X9-DG protein
MEGGNFIYLDGHARHRKFAALRSGEFALSPPDDLPEPKGSDHNGVCGKSYRRQF